MLVNNGDNYSYFCFANIARALQKLLLMARTAGRRVAGACRCAGRVGVGAFAFPLPARRLGVRTLAAVRCVCASCRLCPLGVVCGDRAGLCVRGSPSVRRPWRARSERLARPEGLPTPMEEIGRNGRGYLPLPKNGIDKSG